MSETAPTEEGVERGAEALLRVMWMGRVPSGVTVDDRWRECARAVLDASGRDHGVWLDSRDLDVRLFARVYHSENPVSVAQVVAGMVADQLIRPALRDYQTDPDKWVDEHPKEDT